MVVVVDEPELNLNAGLSLSVWDMLERELADAYYVYATHSVVFAHSRGGQLMVLRGVGRELSVISELRSISAAEVRPFLGNIGGILLSGKTLFVEGEEGSADRFVYEWLVAGAGVRVVPLADCEQVRYATAKSGPWEVMGDVLVVGVVDRDYGEKRGLPNNVVVLDYHEIESYMFHPETLVELSTRLGNKELARTEIEDVLLREWKSVLERELVVSVLKTLSFRYAPMPSREVLRGIQDSARASDAISEAMEEESRKIVGPDAVGRTVCIFEEQHRKAEDAFRLRDMETLLTMLPAKELQWKVCKTLGLENPDAFLRVLVRHLSPDDVQCFRVLRSRILGMFD